MLLAWGIICTERGVIFRMTHVNKFKGVCRSAATNLHHGAFSFSTALFASCVCIGNTVFAAVYMDIQVQQPGNRFVDMSLGLLTENVELFPNLLH